jgi:hypothetical protein
MSRLYNEPMASRTQTLNVDSHRHTSSYIINEIPTRHYFRPERDAVRVPNYVNETGKLVITKDERSRRL